MSLHLVKNFIGNQCSYIEKDKKKNEIIPRRTATTNEDEVFGTQKSLSTVDYLIRENMLF